MSDNRPHERHEGQQQQPSSKFAILPTSPLPPLRHLQQRQRPTLAHRGRSSSHKRRLSILDIARLTICMLGVQFTWTVELGYGTPYLLSLGIPKSLTALVWLAGPLSGLMIQPIVGVFSDSLDWKLGRRRPFILIGAALTAASMYMVAYARELAMLIVRESSGDSYDSSIKAWTIGFAVVGFYCLDFSINAVQASCRSLIMDIPPTDQQEVCNAWSGWMNNLGSVVGFFAGNLNLVQYFAPVLGDSQIKILANLAMAFFASCLAICCLSVTEVQYVPTDEDRQRSVWTTIGNIWRAFKKLPGEIQRICNVQFFAWMGWFPFLFYSTTWVGEILHRYDNNNGNDDDDSPLSSFSRLFSSLALSLSSSPGDSDAKAERAGSFALLCWAGVAVVCGIVIPKITPQEIGLEKWPRNPFTLRNLWTMSLVWFAVCMGMTWFVDDLWSATAVIALCGVPWAVAMWIPFAMVGEIISDMKDRLEEPAPRSRSSRQVSSGYGTLSPAPTLESNGGQSTTANTFVTASEHVGSSSGSNNENGNDGDNGDNDEDRADENSSLILGVGLTASELEAERKKKGPHLDAGLVLGVHNMYIVFPQFADAIIASCLFAIIGSAPRDDQPFTPSAMAAGEPEPVGWVLRFGGIMALVAAYLSRRL
ncbi:hypothetical protein BGX26_003811 [Mortierella sp. AD094]|nr:hypothetical protein BGX26_003811 [Mortierella sp. AD094]